MDDISDHIHDIPKLNFGVVNATVFIRIDPGRSLFVHYMGYATEAAIATQWNPMIVLKIVDADTILLSLIHKPHNCNVQHMSEERIKEGLQVCLIDERLSRVIKSICEYISKLKNEGSI
jgi:hypothetical protein